MTADEFFGWRHNVADRRMDRPASQRGLRWEPVPDYLVRDRDRVYGEAFTRRIRAMGIRDRPTAPRSPWQNGYAERSPSREFNRAAKHSWLTMSRRAKDRKLLAALRYKAFV